MSTLVGVVYPSEDVAKQALDKLASLQKEKLVSLRDAIIATNDGGKVKLNQAVNLTAGGALSGAVWGGIIGLIFLMPIAGMAIGAASGALSGKLSDYGIDDKFAKELGGKLEAGSAGLFLLLEDVTADKVLDEMKQFGGTLLNSNLTKEQEARLQEALNG
jgi:uncharacterized membrane protein